MESLMIMDRFAFFTSFCASAFKSSSAETIVAVIVCIVLFTAAFVISGSLTYKHKMKKLRKNKHLSDGGDINDDRDSLS